MQNFILHIHNPSYENIQVAQASLQEGIQETRYRWYKRKDMKVIQENIQVHMVQIETYTTNKTTESPARTQHLQPHLPEHLFLLLLRPSHKPPPPQATILTERSSPLPAIQNKTSCSGTVKGYTCCIEPKKTPTERGCFTSRSGTAMGLYPLYGNFGLAERSFGSGKAGVRATQAPRGTIPAASGREQRGRWEGLWGPGIRTT